MIDMKPNITTFLDKSFQISIIKKNIFDGTLQFLNEKGFPVRNTILVEKINKISIKEFEYILTLVDDKDSYDKQISSIVKQNLASLRIEKKRSTLK
jgi:hypothetical protein